MNNYTRFEWRRYETTLFSSGEDVEFIGLELTKGSIFSEIPLKTDEGHVKCGGPWYLLHETLNGGGPVKVHSKRVGKMKNYTRNEWRGSSDSLQ